MQADNYQKLRLLGEGTYGRCYLAIDRTTGQQCVLKQIEILGLTQDQIAESVRQAHILQALDSAFIIKFLGSFQSRQGYLNIVMAYAEGGDLSHRIRQARQAEISLEQGQILRWFTQICLAIKHVHDRKIIHRDLKTQNIFLTADEEVKLGDFGIARHLQHTIQKTKSVVGTPYYMSPEICENKEYSFKADIWSLGVILLEMCLLKPPFDANSLPVLALKISKGEYSPVPKHYSKQMRKLVAEMLQIDPNKRPSINEVLKHPLIQPRIAQLMPREERERQFSHTTLHAINIFDKIPPSRGLFIDCNIDNSTSTLDNVLSPKSLQPNKNHDLPVKRVDNYMKQQPRIPADKKGKKTSQIRKREFSEPTLTPKGQKIENQRRIFPSKVIDKKKTKESSAFKKKSTKIIAIISEEIEEVRQIHGQIFGYIQQNQLSHRNNNSQAQIYQEKDQAKLLCQEDLDEEDELCPITSRQPPEPSPPHSPQQEREDRQESIIETLEALILEETHNADLTDLYKNCEQNDGICLIGPCAGLLTLAFALRQQACSN